MFRIESRPGHPLDPQFIRVGPVNINTAPVEVLRALPGMTDALATRIIAHRPYGDQDQKGRGIGDLLLGDVLAADEEDKLRNERAEILAAEEKKASAARIEAEKHLRAKKSEKKAGSRR